MESEGVVTCYDVVVAELDDTLWYDVCMNGGGAVYEPPAAHKCGTR